MKLDKSKSGKGFILGFTLVEMLVTTGIMLFIMISVFSSYPKFRARSVLGAAAREIGLAVRETQVYGLAVKSLSSNQLVYPPYGVHLDAGNKGEIVMFADLPLGSEAGVYENGTGCGTPTTECTKRLVFEGAVSVSKFCVIPGGGEGVTPLEICSDSPAGISQMNITFRRPDPEAVIVVDSIGERYNGAKIYLHSSREPDVFRVVRVWVTGQISIE